MSIYHRESREVYRFKIWRGKVGLDRCSTLADTLIVGICISIQGKKSLTNTAAVANGIQNTMSAVCISVSMSLKKNTIRQFA